MVFGCIHIPKLLVVCEMQKVLSRIWTCISCPFPMKTAISAYIYIYIYIINNTVTIFPVSAGAVASTTASLRRDKTPEINVVNKQSHEEVPVVLDLRGKRRTPSLPSLPCFFWVAVIVPDRVKSMG